MSSDCSEADVGDSAPRLLNELRLIVGRSHVLVGANAKPWATGFRFGSGDALAAVFPGSLSQMWRAAQVCVAADRIIVMQAANTGLTGGSTPHGTYDRQVVIINTSRITGIIPILGGTQVICLAGASLNNLERVLKPIGREPHSIIGSSCIGASVVGGVCNNSGGALVQRGPAYTEYALFGRIDEGRNLVLCNHLGVQLPGDPESALDALEAGRFTDDDVEKGARRASAAEGYGAVVRAVEESTPARFNADPSRLFEASGSAGKLIVFAVRLDTFEKIDGTTVFYIGTNEPARFTAIRQCLLTGGAELPISGEYIHREAFDFADAYGKDTVLAIRVLGTNRLPLLFSIKARLDRFASGLGVRSASDRLMQWIAKLLPDHLPKRMRRSRDAFEHHLVLKVGPDAVAFVQASLTEALGAAGDFFACTDEEADIAMLHRFAVAGAAVRYRAIHVDEVEDIVALDIALPRDAGDWFERLPADIEGALVGKLYYGHFFCHVFHQDYLVRKGIDTNALKRRILQLLDARGAEYPAEHNVGHLYAARPSLASHYQRLDPCNALNPGIGRTSRKKGWT